LVVVEEESIVDACYSPHVMSSHCDSEVAIAVVGSFVAVEALPR